MKTGYPPLALGLSMAVVLAILLNSPRPAGDVLLQCVVFYVLFLILTVIAGVLSFRRTTSALHKAFALIGILLALSSPLIAVLILGRSPGQHGTTIGESRPSQNELRLLFATPSFFCDCVDTRLGMHI